MRHFVGITSMIGCLFISACLGYLSSVTETLADEVWNSGFQGTSVLYHLSTVLLVALVLAGLMATAVVGIVTWDPREDLFK